MARRSAMSVTFLIALVLFLSPLRGEAASFDFKALLDADNNATTGCSAVLPDGSFFSGIEVVLVTSVTADDSTGVGKVTGIAAVRCTAPPATFGPSTILDAGQWNAAGPNLVVETRVTHAQLRSLTPAFTSGRPMRLAFAIAPATAVGGDAISRDDSGPIRYPPPPPGRRHSVGGSRTFVLDGKPTEWTGIAPLSSDAAAYRGVIRLARVFIGGTSDTFYFRFDAGIGGGTFQAVPDALPRTGPAPLTVTFITKAEYADVQLLRYRWDFEGDGIFDTDDPGAKNYTRTFSTLGVRNAVLEITNERKQVATATIPITVTSAPPKVSASVSPPSGPVPLAVTLSGFASVGTAAITKYEWDFEDDGIFDFSSATSGVTTHTYSVARTYTAVFRATDAAGLKSTVQSSATTVRAGPPGSPSARITSPSSPAVRVAPSAVTFTGSATTPAGTITNYEWDFDGDGTYDSASASGTSATFTYNSPGIYAAALRVTNSAGLTAVATVEMTIQMTVKVTPTPDTLRPPGSIAISSTTSGVAPITISIVNDERRTIRTLVKNVNRNAGTYSDSWNGLDDSGALVPEGVYFVVLQYGANGTIVSVDPSTTTGGEFYNPSWALSTTKRGSCTACLFAPYDDDFLEASFTLLDASEVTISIRGYDTTNEVALLFDRRLFGSGRPYKVAWDGTNSKGELVHPALYNDPQFIFGMTAFTLPDNAIFVERSPELSDVTITPNYFDPYTRNFLTPQQPTASIAYTLSKPAKVRLQVLRVGTNIVLRTIDQPNAQAGRGTIVWDGRDDHGIFADKGDYRLALTAMDAAGAQSLVRYGLMKVFY